MFLKIWLVSSRPRDGLAAAVDRVDVDRAIDRSLSPPNSTADGQSSPSDADAVLAEQPALM